MIKRIAFLLVVLSALCACGKKVPVRPPDTQADAEIVLNS